VVLKSLAQKISQAFFPSQFLVFSISKVLEYQPTFTFGRIISLKGLAHENGTRIFWLKVSGLFCQFSVNPTLVESALNCQ
jgi:hypothetical protein